MTSFWSYELSKRWVTSPAQSDARAAMNVLLCGGLAGIVTWASVFPLGIRRVSVKSTLSRSLSDKTRSE